MTTCWRGHVIQPEGDAGRCQYCAARISTPQMAIRPLDKDVVPCSGIKKEMAEALAYKSGRRHGMSGRDHMARLLEKPS